MRQDKSHNFMQVARFYAQTFSKDPSTKVGAVLVDPVDFTQLTQGYNGMPRGVDETKPERQERPLKYAFYEHAERNAIYNLARPQLKASIAVTTSVPSLSCARALISVGAREVYFPVPDEVSEELNVALALFKETGVQVGYYSPTGVLASLEDGRHRRKLEQYIEFAKALPTALAKDPHASSTLFLSPGDYTQLAQGYSGMPRGSDDRQKERYLGELRHMWVESSVRNAIYNCVRPQLKGSTAIVTATTCVECARALAAVGVKEIVYHEPDEGFKQRWGDSIQVALDVLTELGVHHQAINLDK